MSDSPALNSSGATPILKKRKAKIRCVWGECSADTRYPDKSPKETFFIPFPKPGKIREGMTQLKKNEAKDKTEKAKIWVNACNRINFSLENITKDTYICSQHFVGKSGPTDENPHPLKAVPKSQTVTPMTKKRKAPFPRTSTEKKKSKEDEPIENDISKDDDEIEFFVESNPLKRPEDIYSILRFR